MGLPTIQLDAQLNDKWRSLLEEHQLTVIEDTRPEAQDLKERGVVAYIVKSEKAELLVLQGRPKTALGYESLLEFMPRNPSERELHYLVRSILVAPDA